MAASFADLEARVAAQTTVIDSNNTLLAELSQMLKDANGDPAEIQKIIDMIDANTQKISDAIVANTPVAPTP